MGIQTEHNPNLALRDISEFKKGKETKGNRQLSRPIASVIILEATHFLLNGESCTKGKYKTVEVFDKDNSKIQFEGFERIKP